MTNDQLLDKILKHLATNTKWPLTVDELLEAMQLLPQDRPEVTQNLVVAIESGLVKGKYREVVTWEGSATVVTRLDALMPAGRKQITDKRSSKKEWIYLVAAVATIAGTVLAGWKYFESRRASRGPTEVVSPAEESPHSTKEPILIGHTVGELRSINGVRPMMYLEEGEALSEVRGGVYGYALSGHVELVTPIWKREKLDIPLKREASSWRVEVHKTAQGTMMLLVYVDEGSAVRLVEVTQEIGTVFVFFQPNEQRRELVAIPWSRIAKWEDRDSKPRFAKVSLN